MSLVSINIRGLGGCEVEVPKRTVVKEKPGIVCAQETKLVNLCSLR